MEFRKTIEDAEDFARLIVAQLRPGLSGLPITQPEKQGNEYFTLFAGDMVIRIARDENVRAAIQKEVDLLDELHQSITAATLPRVIAAQPEHHFMVIERLPGVVLNKDLLDSLSAQDREAAAHAIGAFAAQMHAAKPRDASILRTDPWYKWDRALDKLHLAVAHAEDEHDIARLMKVRRYMSHYSSLHDHFATIHGDLWAGNILYDTVNKKIGIIDFMNARADYAHRDFVTLSHFYERAFIAQIAEGYRKEAGRRIDLDLVATALDASYISHNPPVRGTFSFKPYSLKP